MKIAFVLLAFTVYAQQQTNGYKLENQQTPAAPAQTGQQLPPAADPNGTPYRVSPGVRIFIAHMEGGLDGFIAAEFIKQKLPVVVVTEEAVAELVLTGFSKPGDNHWYDVAFAIPRDRNEGNVRLIDMKQKRLVWAAEAGDRSMLFMGYRRGGERKIAERITKRLKKELF